MAKGYGQFCPVAKAAEILAERWTLLVVRELLAGSERFTEIQRGVPQMSPSLLSRRLKTLTETGVVRRDEDGPSYRLTKAGEQLRPVVECMGTWGQRWARETVEAGDLDAGLLMWDVRRRIDRERFPADGERVVRFELTGARAGMARWWLVVPNEGPIDICLEDPGFEVALTVESDLRTMTECWLGDRHFDAAMADGEIRLEGSPTLARTFSEWMQRSPFADVDRPGDREN